MDQGNILITGLPRSGTTLTCELLGSLPDTIALDEPLDRVQLAGDPRAPSSRGAFGPLRDRVRARLGRARPSGPSAPPSPSPNDVTRRLERFVRHTRQSALERGMVRTKSVEGQVIGRKISDERDESGARLRLIEVGEVAVNKPLSPEFVLAIKHCGGFTAVLEALTIRFPVFGLVRNPLSVLGSWQSVPMPIRDGHIPLAEWLNPLLAQELVAIDDPTDRQFYILEWFFGRFVRLLPANSVVRYEDIVASGGRALEAISPGAAGLERPLADRNLDRARGDDPATIRALAGRLLSTDGSWWRFYQPEDVIVVLDATT
jgi:hypothetical protein